MNAIVPLDLSRAERALLRGHTKMPNGCWEWQRSTMNSGYGRIYTGFHRDVSAHRAAFIVWNGEIPDGLIVMHVCDNRLCINPAHLKLGTKRDNSRDMVAKGRNVSPSRLRTACPRGHAYDGVNSQGARTCSICHRAAVRRHNQRKFA